MEAEQARLQNDLQRQSDEYNVILTRRDREHQEEDNLATMLRSDVERLAAERWGQFSIVHFAVVCFVTWPLIESEAGVNIVLIQNSCFSYANAN